MALINVEEVAKNQDTNAVCAFVKSVAFKESLNAF